MYPVAPVIRILVMDSDISGRSGLERIGKVLVVLIEGMQTRL